MFVLNIFLKVVPYSIICDAVMSLNESIGCLHEQERLRGYAYFHDKERRSIVDSMCVSGFSYWLGEARRCGTR